MSHLVYFMRAGDTVKIGITSGAVKKRLASVQTGSALPVEVAGVIHCTSREEARATERRLHKRFKDDRLNGEWFRWTEAIERVIAGGSSACPCGECSGVTVASHEMVQWVNDWQRVNQQPAPSTRTLNYLHNLYQSAVGGSGGEAIRLFRDNALGICCHGQPSCGPCSAGRLLACDIARWWFMAKGGVRR